MIEVPRLLNMRHTGLQLQQSGSINHYDLSARDVKKMRGKRVFLNPTDQN